MEPTIFNIAVAVYFCLGFIKFMLCLPHVPRVIGIMSRLSGMQRGGVRARYLFLVPVLIASTSFFAWIPALFKEGFGFFVIYPDFSVARDCVAAYRESHAED